MANLQKAINQNFLDSVLPTYGNARKVKINGYDNSQKMFIIDEYESASGHRYYRGVRFCDRVVFAETVGMYHNWTYIDSLELYAFNGEKLVLVQKKDYDKVFRNEASIKADSEEMLRDYLSGQAKMTGTIIADEQLKQHVHQIVEGSYTSFLDKDFETRLTNILPALESTNNRTETLKLL